MMQRTTTTLFFRGTCRLLKYLCYGVFGFTITYSLSALLGFPALAASLFSILGPWLLKSAIVLACLLTMAAIVESLRH